MGVKTVLSVDDEFHIVNALALKFRSSNFFVVTAGNGREALQRIGESKPDLVITAREQDFDEASGGKVDVDAFVSKPFSPRAMVSQSRKLIGARHE